MAAGEIDHVAEWFTEDFKLYDPSIGGFRCGHDGARQAALEFSGDFQRSLLFVKARRALFCVVCTSGHTTNSSTVHFESIAAQHRGVDRRPRDQSRSRTKRDPEPRENAVADLQHNVDKLEAGAAEVDRVSRFVRSKPVQQRNTLPAADDRSTANDPEHRGLVASEQRIEIARLLIARQRGFIAKLERRGCPTENARHHLSVLQQALALVEKQRDIYWRLQDIE
jgi:hypothetical protein